jgi:hypothetical protein
LLLAYELEHRQAAHDVVSTWFPWCITASTLKWDFGQAAHLRPANKRLGLQINFKRALIKDGIKRVANGLAEQSSSRLRGLGTPG